MLYSLLFLFCIILGQQKYSECNSIPIVTNPPHRADGFGAQFLLVINSVLYAELNYMEYVYTPFTAMEHNYYNDPNFIAKKEWLINFIGNFEINTRNNVMSVSNVEFFFLEENLIKLVNSFSLKKIKKFFRANKNINNYFNSENLNIAIHIRRPNPHDNRVDGTDTPDDVFLTVINKLRNIYFDKNPLFHLYSQGERENFKLFNAHDVILHLNESIEDTFTALVLADILVTSRSTFSYTAGLLSEGSVYYIPFCCARLPHWVSIYSL